MIRLVAQVPEDLAGHRLDAALAQLFSQYSRTRIQQWLDAGYVHVDGRVLRRKDRLIGGEEAIICAPEPEVLDNPAQAIVLNVVYEDAQILVLNKPAGLVVHPAPGHPDGTLVNALLHHRPSLAQLPRAGIVHRLDKDTSGLMVVAATLPAHTELVRQLQARTVKREYLALVQGELIAGGRVDAPIGRHPVDRKRMAVVEGVHGRPAITHYRIAQRFQGYTLLRVQLETGRTHQIRVHMQHIRHPIVGDPVYGPRAHYGASHDATLQEALRTFGRQALHATALGLIHPVTGESLSWEVALADDLCALLQHLALSESQTVGVR